MKFAVFAGSLATAGCYGAADVPPVPDLTELRAQYSHPSAALNEQTIMETIALAPDVNELAAGFSSTKLATDGIDQASTSTGQRSGDGVQLQGAINVTIRCPGDAFDPVYDAAQNGSIGLTIAIDENRIKRGIFGVASNCHTRAEGWYGSAQIRFNGPFAFDLGGDIGIGARWSGTLLMAMEGELEVNGTLFTNMTGRLTRDGFESLFRIPGDDTVILLAGENGIGVRDSNGVWRCGSQAGQEVACARE